MKELLELQTWLEKHKENAFKNIEIFKGNENIAYWHASGEASAFSIVLEKVSQIMASNV
jgi:hypothetical protein